MAAFVRRRTLIAVAQMTATADVAANMAIVRGLVAETARRGARILFLPECFHYIGDGSGGGASVAEALDGPSIASYCQMARENRLMLSLGGFPESAPPSLLAAGLAARAAAREVAAAPSPGQSLPAAPPAAEAASAGGGAAPTTAPAAVAPPPPPSACNTHLVVSEEGAVLCAYRKGHLFNVDLPGGLRLRESDYTLAGSELHLVRTPAGVLGLSTCYDLRFPALYEALRGAGAEILAVPAAFTVPTGCAHWEVLLRARAIEAQCYVAAAAQVGRHNEKRASWGHAMIIDPWGTILAQCGGGDGATIAVAEVDLDLLDDVRRRMPVFEHRRPDLYAATPIVS